MRALALPVLTFLLAATLAGCIGADDPGDAADDSMDDATALGAFTLPETITGLEDLGTIDFSGFGGDDFKIRGNGVWLHDGLLYVSGSAFAIVDVSDPTDVTVLSVLDNRGARDVDIMEHPNGNLYAVLAGSPGIVLVDVTDPTAPFEAGNVTIGYHNIVTVPGTALVYNSRSLYRGDNMEVGPVDTDAGPEPATEGGLVDIVDFTDPANGTIHEFRFPKVAMTVGGVPKPVKSLACHDISVYPEADRAYCAGVTETHVWDISDPKDPTIIQVVDNPGTNIHHAAYAAKDHTLLIIGDELGGAAFSPGCATSDQAYGGVWFVDISDLATPIPLGWWAPEEAHEEPVRVDPGAGNPLGVVQAPTCTAHFGNIVEDRDVLTMGFYTAGVFLIDFSDPTDPVEIANHRPAGTNVWEGRYYRGHVFTGDSGLGVSVLEIVGDGEVVYETSE